MGLARWISISVTGAAVALGGLACGSPAPDATADVVTVYAAASLAVVFPAVAAEFEDAHPGIEVRLNFAGSTDLVAQVEQGAGADVLALADEATMEAASQRGLIATEPVVFATNSMAIAVPRGNPAGIQRWEDLAAPDVKVVVCAPPVPCGAATGRIEARSGIELRPVSEENSVAGVVGKVGSGEADAGVVYASDVLTASSRIEGVPIPAPINATNSYVIAEAAPSVMDDAGQSDAAGMFVGWVLQSRAQQILTGDGFEVP